MTYTEKELDQFLHGISLSLLSKKSAQHWRYDEETAKEIEWLEALERKVRADKADRKTENSSEKPNNCEELNAYRECVKSRSFWDSKHCDGCYFDERCPFDEPKDEPQTVLEAVLDRQTDEDRRKMAESVRKAIKDEPQTKCYLRTSCDHYGDKQVCGRCREYNLYSHTKDELQTDCDHKCIQTEIGCEKTDCAWK